MTKPTILIHSNGIMSHTGYAVQCRLLMKQLRDHGYQVANSALTGLFGTPVKVDGFVVLPGGQYEYSWDMINYYADLTGADLILTLMDLHKLIPAAEGLRKRNVLAWLPVDCDPISRLDRAALEKIQPVPLAMSRFTERVIKAAGFADCQYAPHAVDTAIFKPPEDRFAFRAKFGLDENTFVAGICAANNDVVRKAFWEQLRAFDLFRRKHKNSVLMLHTILDSNRGLPLYEMIEDLELQDKVIVSDRDSQIAGQHTSENMAEWYGGLDVLMQCTYAEAFGIPSIEAQACGTPIIGSTWSATKELIGPGWGVRGREFRNYVHRAMWYQPDIEDIKVKLIAAKHGAGDPALRAKAREFALQYDTGTVFEQHWSPILDKVEEVL